MKSAGVVIGWNENLHTLGPPWHMIGHPWYNPSISINDTIISSHGREDLFVVAFVECGC